MKKKENNAETYIKLVVPGYACKCKLRDETQCNE